MINAFMDIHHLEPQQIGLPILVALCVGALLYVVAYPYFSGEAKAEKRVTALQNRPSVGGAGLRVNDVAKRRKAVADSLKEIDQRAKSKKISFEMRMAQAGLTWSKTKFWIVSAIMGAVAVVVAVIVSGSPLMIAAAAVIGGLGLPRWYIGRKRKKRLNDFLKELPGAVDIIVRGVKAGIPLGDCIRNIASEAAEPVKTEFRAIVESQTMGLTIPEAVERLIDRVPLPEANFFAIVINIQAKAGGNLAEALTNLSAVLRDRKKMKGKIKAMSSEAKASAGIIGCLPPLVAFFVWLTSPAYISLLFVTSTGHMVLAGCALWMGTGIFVMKKMISFDI